MRSSSAKALQIKGALASAGAAATALVACSLGLQNEDSYFSRLDASLGDDVVVVPREGGAPMEAHDAPETAPTPDAATVDHRGATVHPPDGGGHAAVDSGFDAASLEPAVLQVYYPFEDDAGSTVVADKSGNHLDAVLMGGVDGGSSPPVFDPLGHVGHGLKLDGTLQQYASLPSRVVAGFDSMSVSSCWISLQTAAVWNRLFDFNNGSTVWVYFSPTGWNTTTMLPGTHFAVSSGAHLDPEMQLTETVPADATWHHVVVVLDKPYFFYYLDGVEKYRMTDMTLTPNDINATQNWLGRSAYPNDPYLTATIDEFRLYSGGLTPAQVAQLASQ